MKTISLILVSLLLLQLCSADDIYLKDGAILKNVKLLEYRNQFGKQSCIFLFNGREYFYAVDVIEKIDPVPYDPAAVSVREKTTPGDVLSSPNSQQQFAPLQKDTLKLLYERLATFYAPPKKVYPNLIWLSVSAISAVIAWDAFSDVGDIQDNIDVIEQNRIAQKAILGIDVSPDNSRYESAKARKSVLGVISLAAGIASFSYSIQSVEIKSDGKSLSLAYHF